MRSSRAPSVLAKKASAAGNENLDKANSITCSANSVNTFQFHRRKFKSPSIVESIPLKERSFPRQPLSEDKLTGRNQCSPELRLNVDKYVAGEKKVLLKSNRREVVDASKSVELEVKMPMAGNREHCMETESDGLQPKKIFTSEGISQLSAETDCRGVGPPDGSYGPLLANGLLKTPSQMEDCLAEEQICEVLGLKRSYAMIEEKDGMSLKSIQCQNGKRTKARLPMRESHLVVSSEIDGDVGKSGNSVAEEAAVKEAVSSRDITPERHERLLAIERTEEKCIIHIPEGKKGSPETLVMSGRDIPLHPSSVNVNFSCTISRSGGKYSTTALPTTGDSSLQLLSRKLPLTVSTPGNDKKLEKTMGQGQVEVPADYYSVMFCVRKKNAKRKGPWSDGVLVARGRPCSLQDLEGKFVSKGDVKGCKDMPEGASLLMGKFEVEVMRRASEEEYTSGTIFMGAIAPQSDATQDVAQSYKKRTFKSFCPVGSQAFRSGAPVAPRMIIKEGSLVLSGKDAGDEAVPVVVDPYVAMKLRPHQRDGVKFMYECVMGLRAISFSGCLLADEMGLGKTLQVIALIWTLLQKGPVGCPSLKRVVVICPSSLVQNWGNEVRKWLGSERLKALVVHAGTATKEVKQKLLDFKMGKICPLLITSYELLRKYKDIIASAKPELLVCDEAHRLKNCSGNKTIDALLAIECPRKILLTGTPVQNDLKEFYAMIDFANPNLLGPLSAFKRLYADPIERSRDRNASEKEREIGRARSLELQARTRFCILRRTADINIKYLPNKTEFVVFCRLQPLQISLYEAFIKSNVVETLFSSVSPSATILTAIGTLRKLCNHPRLIHGGLLKETDWESPIDCGTDGADNNRLKHKRPNTFTQGNNLIESMPHKVSTFAQRHLPCAQVAFKEAKQTPGKAGLISMDIIRMAFSTLLGPVWQIALSLVIQIPSSSCLVCFGHTSRDGLEDDGTASGKLACLSQLLQTVNESSTSGPRDRVVVVSNFTQTLDVIQELCKIRGWHWLRLDGSTEVSARQSLVDQFNSGFGREFVFLLSSKAGGTGLNLVGANRLVLFDPDWNPATDAQAMARIWREGQLKPVIIYRLLTTGSIEEKIYQRQIMKGEVAAAVEENVDAGFPGNSGGRHFSREELRELFTLNLETQCDTFDLLSRSRIMNADGWRDYSPEVDDVALKKAILSGVVTFVSKKGVGEIPVPTASESTSYEECGALKTLTKNSGSLELESTLRAMTTERASGFTLQSEEELQLATTCAESKGFLNAQASEKVSQTLQTKTGTLLLQGSGEVTWQGCNEHMTAMDGTAAFASTLQPYQAGSKTGSKKLASSSEDLWHSKQKNPKDVDRKQPDHPSPKGSRCNMTDLDSDYTLLENDSFYLGGP